MDRQVSAPTVSDGTPYPSPPRYGSDNPWLIILAPVIKRKGLKSLILDCPHSLSLTSRPPKHNLSTEAPAHFTAWCGMQPLFPALFSSSTEQTSTILLLHLHLDSHAVGHDLRNPLPTSTAPRLNTAKGPDRRPPFSCSIAILPADGQRTSDSLTGRRYRYRIGTPAASPLPPSPHHHPGRPLTSDSSGPPDQSAAQPPPPLSEFFVMAAIARLPART
ncbi:hypothetical protein B0H66DRAFT_172433 [Apodospora peruviana]|uniref:Uncharacterized protein n=1 Tax=Apodospora peruviana TaxID=516989 RepID=A0AAE0HRW3_9PEZI|nr:hypothetical protein B0H66DRAFT_172433 [Apodospora peruviana]